MNVIVLELKFCNATGRDRKTENYAVQYIYIYISQTYYKNGKHYLKSHYTRHVLQGCSSSWLDSAELSEILEVSSAVFPLCHVAKQYDSEWSEQASSKISHNV